MMIYIYIYFYTRGKQPKWVMKKIRHKYYIVWTKKYQVYPYEKCSGAQEGVTIKSGPHGPTIRQVHQVVSISVALQVCMLYLNNQVFCKPSLNCK